MQKIKLYITLLFAGIAISGIGLLIILLTTSPDQLLGLALFYFFAGLFSFLLFLILGIFIRRLFGQREFFNQYLSTSARQAVWFALILLGSLVLSSFGLFSWISGGSLVAAIIFFEFYLASKK